MTDSKESQDAEAQVAKRLYEIRLFDIPEEDWFAFREIMKAYGYNKATALRALLDAYYVTREIGSLHSLLGSLGQRVERLEALARKELASGPPQEDAKNESVKTFGGGKI